MARGGGGGGAALLQLDQALVGMFIAEQLKKKHFIIMSLGHCKQYIKLSHIVIQWGAGMVQ